MPAPTITALGLQAHDLSSLFLAITEYAPLPMAAVEGAAHIVRHVNPAFCHLLGKPREQLVGSSFAKLFPGNDICISLLDRVYRTSKSESYTGAEPSESNSAFRSFAMWPLQEDDRSLGVMIQITETARHHEQLIAVNEALLLGSVRQHELTEASECLNARLQIEIASRQQLETQLLQAQKMEAVGQLTGGIAHDFNNILTVITGYSELLLDRLPPGDPMRETLTIIRDAGDQAAALTRQLLAFSRRTVLAPIVLDLNAVISNSEPMLRRLLSEDLLLTLELDHNLRHVRLDPTHLAQVLINLAVNASDAMPRGGKLTIQTANLQFDASESREPPAVPSGPSVLLRVADTGCGMPPDVKARIFEPFFTTKGVGKGTGLGLAVVYGIIKQSGGHIEVDSVEDVGTTFSIYLPGVDDPIPLPEKPQPRPELRGTETILLVEDDLHLRRLAALALQDHGYSLLEAADGQDALRLLQDHPDPIDLLVTDVVMPHLGGRELAAILRPRFPRMKVLYLSGYTSDAVLRHGIQQADFAFLQKPYTPSSLRQKIRQTLHP